jgi:hypothetical protein
MEWLESLFHGWILKSLHGLSKRRKRGVAPTVKRFWNPMFRPRAIYSPALVIGSTDMGSVLSGV